MKIYGVGGFLRDRILGRPVKDRDYVVLGADESRFLAAFPHARKQGREYPVYRVGSSEYVLSSCLRIEDDLMERDLTINALAEDDMGHLFTHPEALQDLASRTLRPVRRENYLKDPVRVFRAARFASEMPEFTLSGDLKETMASSAFRLDECTAERVGHELVRALHSTLPSRFFRTLADTGCLVPWFEEMEKARQVPAGPLPWHEGSLFDHILDVMDALHGKALWVWMGLCHDLGKLASPPEQWPSHHGHDGGGVVLAKELGQRLRLPNKWVDAGKAGARFHMKAGLYDKLRPGTRVDFLSALHRLDLVEALFALVRADHGDDFHEMAVRDLGIMLAVHLPAGHGLKGPEAGRQLRNLRCQALAAAG